MPLTRSAIEFMFSQPPPRQVDNATVQAVVDIFLTKATRVRMCVVVVFSCIMALSIGIFFTGKFRYAEEWRMLIEPTTVSRGVILKSEARKGSKGSITYFYEFEFTPATGQLRSPVKGACISSSPAGERGAEVTVEYVAAEPHIARISGTRLNPVPLYLLACVILYFLLFVCIIFGIIRYRKKWVQRLLREGVMVQAGLQEMKRGPKGIMSIVLAYELGGQAQTATMQAVLREQELAMLEDCQKTGGKLAAIVHPAKKKRIFILDLIMPQGQQ